MIWIFLMYYYIYYRDIWLPDILRYTKLNLVWKHQLFFFWIRMGDNVRNVLLEGILMRHVSLLEISGSVIFETTHIAESKFSKFMIIGWTIKVFWIDFCLKHSLLFHFNTVWSYYSKFNFNYLWFNCRINLQPQNIQIVGETSFYWFSNIHIYMQLYRVLLL